jgi:two-component system, LuxR family, response regulator FixJ
LAVQTFATSAEFLRVFDPLELGCLVLDVRLAAGQTGLDLQDELQRRGVPLPIIVMTGYATVPTSVRALKAGAFDFLRKPVHPKKLLERIHAAIAVHQRALSLASDRAFVQRRLAQLTTREQEVMEMLLDGKTSKEIATALRVSVRTVEGHRRMVLMKMNASSATQLMRAVLSVREPTPRR